jgi:hypothetical protein
VLDAYGSEVSLSISAGALALSDDEIETWVRRSVLAVTTYYGHSPAAHVVLELQPVRGTQMGNGREAAQRGPPTIRIEVGSDVGSRQVRDDWVLVHEMVHLATPSLPAEQLWFEEGIATYVEPIARVQCNSLSMTDVLQEWVESMPEGEPRPGDRGLDHTHTWGRTYWGGALFCLSADVAIHDRTKNRYGLQDALRAVQEKLGGGTSNRSIDEVIAIGDAAVGVAVLREMYDQQAREPTEIDLPALWSRLGIVGRGKTLHVDGSAPLASALKAIFEARPPRGVTKPLPL